MMGKIEIFISYSHKDEKLKRELLNHLKFLERLELAVSWHDQMIGAGNDWGGEILQHLKVAHIILLLVSPDFIASDFCTRIEFVEAAQRHEAGEVSIIPVILRPCKWERMPFSKFNALPHYGKPVTSSKHWGTHDEAFCVVADGIEKVVNNLLSQLAEGPVKELLDSSSLHDALLTLDFQEQVSAFRQSLRDHHSIGAFLIHGELGYGQKWLLNKLAMPIPGCNVNKPPFKFNFRRMAASSNFYGLLREFGKWINPIKPPDMPQKMIEQVHGLWQRQTVILIMEDLQRMSEQCVDEFIRVFWDPLMDMAEAKPCKSPNHYLLLFLIDNDGYVDEWKIPFFDELNLPWKSHMPIKLKKISRFTMEVLDYWLNQENRIPPVFTAPDILANTDSDTPEAVLVKICLLCGHDWYEREREWMKY